jgi:hypothetical protein
MPPTYSIAVVGMTEQPLALPVGIVWPACLGVRLSQLDCMRRPILLMKPALLSSFLPSFDRASRPAKAEIRVAIY